MLLRTTVSASAPSDAYDRRAYIYCQDPVQNYCFSLSRKASSDWIEVMVVDQVVHRVVELQVALNPDGFKATLNAEAAVMLDGHSDYDIEFLPGGASHETVEAALNMIFQGKGGLSVSDGVLRLKHSARSFDSPT